MGSLMAIVVMGAGAANAGPKQNDGKHVRPNNPARPVVTVQTRNVAPARVIKHNPAPQKVVVIQNNKHKGCNKHYAHNNYNHNHGCNNCYSYNTKADKVVGAIALGAIAGGVIYALAK